MSASQNDGHDDLESGSVDAEQSETRMRQALDRLSGDKHPERQVDRPGDRLGDRLGDRPGDRLGDRHSGAPRSQGSLQASFSSAGPRRHRYVQDGEVPVVQISSLRDRRRDAAVAVQPAQDVPSDGDRAALAQERAARQRAEQALERAQATLHALETRLGHAEITRQEAAEQALTHEAANARLQSDLGELTTRLKAEQLHAAEALRRQSDLEAELEEARAELAASSLFALEPPPLQPRPASAAEANSDAAAVRRQVRRGKIARVAQPVLTLAESDEPEPVKWWLTQPPKLKPKRRAG